MDISIKPLEGIFWEDKSILLGEERRNVEKTFTNIHFEDKCVHKNKLSFYLFNNTLRIDFDKNDCVEFIEFLGRFNIEIQAEIYGVDVLKSTADELFKLLKEHNEGEIGDSENGYYYDFMNISVGIWRESTPESLSEFIEEIRNDESIDKTIVEEKIKEEKLKAHYWATLGIGIENYYLSECY